MDVRAWYASVSAKSKYPVSVKNESVRDSTCFANFFKQKFGKYFKIMQFADVEEKAAQAIPDNLAAVNLEPHPHPGRHSGRWWRRLRDCV